MLNFLNPDGLEKFKEDYDVELENRMPTILNESGTALAKRKNLQLINATITDDPENDTTIIEVQGGTDTSDATATSLDILTGKTAYIATGKTNGQMANNGNWNATITDKTDNISIPSGFHNGNGHISIAATEREKIVSTNIKQGVSILGVQGSYTGGSAPTLQVKSATPYTTSQAIRADSGYDALEQVNIAAISYATSENSAGGITVTIGTVAPS